MSAVYLGEIIALILFVVAVIMGGAGAYLLIRHFHRKWYWEDEDRKNRMLKDAMRQAGIDYIVDDGGKATPTGGPRPRSSGRSAD